MGQNGVLEALGNESQFSDKLMQIALSVITELQDKKFITEEIRTNIQGIIERINVPEFLNSNGAGKAEIVITAIKEAFTEEQGINPDALITFLDRIGSVIDGIFHNDANEDNGLNRPFLQQVTLISEYNQFMAALQQGLLQLYYDVGGSIKPQGQSSDIKFLQLQAGSTGNFFDHTQDLDFTRTNLSGKIIAVYPSDGFKIGSRGDQYKGEKDSNSFALGITRAMRDMFGFQNENMIGMLPYPKLHPFHLQAQKYLLAADPNHFDPQITTPFTDLLLNRINKAIEERGGNKADALNNALSGMTFSTASFGGAFIKMTFNHLAQRLQKELQLTPDQVQKDFGGVSAIQIAAHYNARVNNQILQPEFPINEVFITSTLEPYAGKVCDLDRYTDGLQGYGENGNIYHLNPDCKDAARVLVVTNNLHHDVKFSASPSARIPELCRLIVQHDQAKIFSDAIGNLFNLTGDQCIDCSRPDEAKSKLVSLVNEKYENTDKDKQMAAFITDLEQQMGENFPHWLRVQQKNQRFVSGNDYFESVKTGIAQVAGEIAQALLSGTQNNIEPRDVILQTAGVEAGTGFIFSVEQLSKVATAIQPALAAA